MAEVAMSISSLFQSGFWIRKISHDPARKIVEGKQ
jgi:hypothetical protein